MKIKNNTIYHLPTEELKRDFLSKCEKEGFKWNDGSPASSEVGNTTYGSGLCINTSNGRMMYADRNHYENYCGYSIITWEIEKPTKPTIIKLPNGHKIVFNKPYTIYTDGTFTGKAKCNPVDEYNAIAGLVLAVIRYQESIKNNKVKAVECLMSLFDKGVK